MHIEVIRGNISRLVIFVLVLATIIVVACGGDDAAEAPAEATAVPPTAAPTPTPVDLSAITSELQRSISDAVSGIEVPEGMTEAEVQQIVANAVAAAQADAPEPLTEEEIAQIVAAAIPTPVPTPTAISAEAIREAALVNPGTVTVLNTVWGPELFTNWAWGEVMGYNRQIHSYWMIGSKDVEILPGAATTWEVSPDGLSWIFTIRDGIKFHNGHEFNIDDAVFTMNATYGTITLPDGTVWEAKEQGGQNVLTVARATESIEAVGPESFKVTHTQPLAYLPFILTDMATNNNGALMPKDYFEEVGRDGYDGAPIGAGPFRLLSHTFNDEMVLERFDEYWNPSRLSNFRTLHMRLVPEASTRVSALIAGQADIVDANLQVMNQIEESGNRIVIAKEAAYMWMFMPGCHDTALPCNKKEFRQAMDYAVDKQLIVDQLYGPDVAEVKGFSFVFPSSLGYSPGLDPFPYDPEKARELLAQAGYPGGQGLPTQIINTWVAGDVPFLPEQAQLIAQMWRDNLGIDAEVKVGEEVATRERWFGGQLDGEYLLRPNESRWDTAGGMLSLYGDPERAAHIAGKRQDIVDRVREATSVVDPALRQDILADAWMFLREEHYEWTTGITHSLYGVSPRIETWEPWPLVAYLTGVWTIRINE